MGRYARLHDIRVHSDLVEKKPFQGLTNSASCDHAAQAGESKAEAEEAKYRHVGGGSGRLGAAVQRAMAMRERVSTQDGNVKGIGAMRQLCNIPWPPPNNIHSTLSAAGPEEARESYIILSPPSGIRSESTKYSRFFCSVHSADEDQYNLNKAADLGKHCSCCGPQSHQVCEACNSLPLLQRSADAPAKKNGFLRKLFQLHKTTISASASFS